jgi:hypothetical protein
MAPQNFRGCGGAGVISAFDDVAFDHLEEPERSPASEPPLAPAIVSRKVLSAAGAPARSLAGAWTAPKSAS